MLSKNILSTYRVRRPLFLGNWYWQSHREHKWQLSLSESINKHKHINIYTWCDPAYKSDILTRLLIVTMETVLACKCTVHGVQHLLLPRLLFPSPPEFWGRERACVDSETLYKKTWSWLSWPLQVAPFCSMASSSIQYDPATCYNVPGTVLAAKDTNWSQKIFIWHLFDKGLIQDVWRTIITQW